MNYRKILIILITLLFMVGCSAEAEGDKDAESNIQEQEYNPNLPVGVNNGTVDLEFYNELMRFWDNFEKYNYDKEYFLQFDKMIRLTADRDVLDEYETKLREHDVYLESFYLSPSNDAEMELNKHLNSYFTHVANKNSYMRKYVKDLDSMYRKLSAEEFDEASISLEALINAMEKHELFIEKD